jgi:hypothetical protein
MVFFFLPNLKKYYFLLLVVMRGIAMPKSDHLVTCGNCDYYVENFNYCHRLGDFNELGACNAFLEPSATLHYCPAFEERNVEEDIVYDPFQIHDEENDILISWGYEGTNDNEFQFTDPQFQGEILVPCLEPIVTINQILNEAEEVLGGELGWKWLNNFGIHYTLTPYNLLVIVEGKGENNPESQMILLDILDHLYQIINM